MSTWGRVQRHELERQRAGAGAGVAAGAGAWAGDSGGPEARPGGGSGGDGDPRPAPESRSIRIGRRGEQVAADYLRHRGYRLLDRNWRSPEGEVPGELDLVLRLRGTLVICEVKTRTGGRLAHPAEAVTPAKAAKLRKLAIAWLNEPDRRHSFWRPLAERFPTAIRAATSFVAPPSASPGPSPSAIRIDVVAVRLAPREPFAILDVEHLIGVA